MKSLLITLLLLLLISSCKKDEIIVVNYNITNNGKGITTYAIGKDTTFIHCNKLDSTMMVHVNDRSHTFRLRVRNVITNGEYADIIASISIRATSLPMINHKQSVGNLMPVGIDC